jgi:hypothetical protein
MFRPLWAILKWNIQLLSHRKVLQPIIKCINSSRWGKNFRQLKPFLCKIRLWIKVDYTSVNETMRQCSALCGSVVDKTLRYKPEGRGFENRWDKFLNLPKPSSRSRPWCKRNESPKKYKCLWGVKRGRCVGLTTLPPSLSRLSRQCGILDISEPHRSPRPVTGIALLFYSLSRY